MDRRVAGTGTSTDPGEDGGGMAEFRKGDKVTWQSHGSTAEGTVERKITEDTEAGGRTVRATTDDPQYLVRSDKSGGTAVHKPSALKKKG
jgi:hypothetical protein